MKRSKLLALLMITVLILSSVTVYAEENEISIDTETNTQSEILDNGERIIQETRRIDEDGKTYSMREKVDAVDYKYYI